ncbi:MAG: hypothetical protein JJU40_06875 [Rhodobacteraceae bacterium]|nr:hypothetical protein [Paracoccaceae bacterium]
MPGGYSGLPQLVLDPGAGVVLVGLPDEISQDLTRWVRAAGGGVLVAPTGGEGEEWLARLLPVAAFAVVHASADEEARRLRMLAPDLPLLALRETEQTVAPRWANASIGPDVSLTALAAAYHRASFKAALLPTPPPRAEPEQEAAVPPGLTTPTASSRPGPVARLLRGLRRLLVGTAETEAPFRPRARTWQGHVADEAPDQDGAVSEARLAELAQRFERLVAAPLLPRGLALLCSPDDEAARAMRAWVEAEGGALMVLAEPDVPAPWLGIHAARLDVCLVDADLHGDTEETVAYCLALRRAAPGLPVVILSSEVQAHDFTPARMDVCDVALRTPLSRTAFVLGLQAAYRNARTGFDESGDDPVS